ncbi:hypothetical protein KKH56_04050 [bacterium]|nr:hypothetical protein [bacterium]
MDKIRIIFRVDGDFKIGLGHLVRSLTLAKSLREEGFEIGFLTMTPLVEEAAKRQGYPGRPIKDKFGWPDTLRANLIITDINHTPADYMRRLRATGARLVTFDDLGQGRDLADLIVDANLPSSSGSTGCLYGPDYIILRKEFSQYARREKIIEREIRQILVSMGGSDPSNLTLKVAEALKGLDLPVLTNIIIGKAFGQKEELLKSVEGGERFRIEEDVLDISEKMYRADLAVTSAGVTMFELACLGTPGVIIAQDEVQAKNLIPFKEQGLFIDLGLLPTIDKIRESVKRLALDANARLEMSRYAKKFVDGQGLFRVTRAIKSILGKEKKLCLEKSF